MLGQMSARLVVCVGEWNCEREVENGQRSGMGRKEAAPEEEELMGTSNEKRVTGPLRGRERSPSPVHSGNE